MDHTNLKEEYVPTWQIFHDAGMKVTATKNVTQRTLSLEEKLTLNLIGADVGSLMHMKLRYFRWLDNATAPVSEAVVTGSLNPEVTATINDDTLVVFRGATEDIQRYRNATADVRNILLAAVVLTLTSCALRHGLNGFAFATVGFGNHTRCQQL